MQRKTSAPDPTTVEPAPGATEVVEAATAEAAIAEVHERLGPDARILDARRVLRGGIGGFFARQVTQLHAAPGAQGRVDSAPERPAAAAEVDDVPDAVPDAGVTAGATAGAPAEDTSVEDTPVERLLAGADEVPDAVDFATFLRQQLAERQAAGEQPLGSDVEVAVSAAAPADAHPDPTAGAAPATQGAAPATAGGAPATARPHTWQPASEVASAYGAPAVPTASQASPQQAPAPPPAVETAAAAQAPRPPAADGLETTARPSVGPPWSTTSLVRLGVPGEFARSLDLPDGADDVTWTSAIADAVRPICRPLPTGAAVLVGPRAPEIAEAAGIPVARSDRFRAAMRPERWVHLVVGGDGWRDLLAEDPLAVSWADPADLPEALRCAVELGLVLGFGPLEGEVRRATPVEVATALRRLVADLHVPGLAKGRS